MNTNDMPKKKSSRGRPEIEAGQYLIRYRSLNEMTFNWSPWRYDKRVFDDLDDAKFFAGQIDTPASVYETEVAVIDHDGETVWVTTL